MGWNEWKEHKEYDGAVNMRKEVRGRTQRASNGAELNGVVEGTNESTAWRRWCR